MAYSAAPKRKRPRPVNLEDEKPSMFAVRNGPISSTAKVDADQPSKIENSPIFERGLGSAAENGGVSYGLLANRLALSSTERLQSQPEAVKPESNSINLLSDSKPLIEESDSKDMAVAKEEPRSPRKESSRLTSEDDRERLAPTKGNSKTSEMESLREEKFQIDLMAPPPMRSSPEGVKEVDFVAVDHKPVVPDVETETKSMIKEGEKALKIGKEDINVEPEEKKAKLMAEEVESQKPIVNKERNIDLQLDLEKTDGDSGIVTVSGNKSQQNVQKLQQQQPITERTGSVPLPMSMAGWPGGLPHMGYMAPLQGVVSMDGSAVSSAALQPPHLLFSQQRPKRCATHFYIAQNIQYNQQFTRMNSFWPAAAGSALQFGAKACNMNAVPTPEMQAGRGLNTVQGKGQGLAIFPGHTGKDKTSQATNIVDIAQKKQILLQQAVPHGAPNNLMHGPAFIFPLSQQQAAAAASVRPGTLKSPPSAGGSVSASGSNSASISAASTAIAGAPAMTFNYPNMPGNETQYLAILQNGAYPIPIPAHVGATPAYRGNHPQPMPFFNGTFYSPQILHHSQLQQQQPPATQSQHSQQDHHKPSISGGSSSSQKHLQNQQQRAHGSVLNGGSEKLQGFPALKSQPLQLQQQQQVQSHNVPHQARQLEAELGSEDSPSTADSQVSRANMSHCGQNFAVAMHPPNFALMHPASMSTFSGSNVASGNPSEKKQHQAKAQGTKTGVEPLQSQAFAMSFASINGATTAPGLDISSIAQNHALIQSLPEAARHGYHFMAAAAAPQVAHNKKRENDSSNAEEERKSIAGGKAPAISVPSIPFSRPDLTDSSASTAPVSSVMESSARTLNLGSSTAWTSGSFMSTAINNVHNPSMQQQMQRSQQQQQQQHMTQLQKQHQLVAAAPASTRNKTPVSSNGNVYPEPISSPASMAAKFPNALSAFPQNLVQSNSPAQSPQWKNSVRTTTSQVPAQSLASTSSSLKHLSQQQSRNQQGHTQISFAAGSKPSITGQGQPPPNGNQSRSPSVGMGSPTSSISKGAGGSPMTSLASTNNKGSQASTLSSQQAKITPSAPTQKSSPVGGRNIPSILGHPHNNTASSTSGTRPQLAHQQKHQQTPKHAFPQAHMLYTNAYMQAAGSANASSGASGFYLQRHREQQQQQPTGSSSTSTGMLLLCPPVTLSSTSTNDPAKAVAAAAAAAGNMKGGGLPSQGIIHAHFAPSQSPGKSHQLVPASFPYSHTLPPAVQVKPAEQKQPTGN
uniref:Protein TIME FOR COFFEE n=1 Tax=Rhizophora mucronata TaxID=61149 RepID=A0A2P2MG54_RHIMU